MHRRQERGSGWREGKSGPMPKPPGLKCMPKPRPKIRIQTWSTRVELCQRVELCHNLPSLSVPVATAALGTGAISSYGPITDRIVPFPFPAMVRLITHNLLACHAKGCTSNNFPLKLTNVTLALREADFNPDFLRGFLPRIEWDALIQASREVQHLCSYGTSE